MPLEGIRGPHSAHGVPPEHQKHIITTNPLERTFVGEKRRTKIIPRFFDGKTNLKMVCATMMRASQKYKRMKMTDYDPVHLRNIRTLY
jgi:putative transposase